MNTDNLQSFNDQTHCQQKYELSKTLSFSRNGPNWLLMKTSADVYIPARIA
jgi:ribosomal protein L39E